MQIEQPAEFVRTDQVPGCPVDSHGRKLIVDHHHSTTPLAGDDNGIRIFKRGGERFLAEDVTAGGEREFDMRPVEITLLTDCHNIRAKAFHHFSRLGIHGGQPEPSRERPGIRVGVRSTDDADARSQRLVRGKVDISRHRTESYDRQSDHALSR